MTWDIFWLMLPSPPDHPLPAISLKLSARNKTEACLVQPNKPTCWNDFGEVDYPLTDDEPGNHVNPVDLDMPQKDMPQRRVLLLRY
jgi:hypothetical protein